MRLLKKAIKEFKLNSLLIYVNEERLFNSQRFLDDLIAFCLNNSIYAYLVPTQNTDEYATKHFENAPFFIASLAKRYKKYSNVLYGIWAEPNFGNFHSWEIYFEKGINLIRKVNPNAVIGVAGDFYGRKFPTNSRLYDYQNIFLDFHDYPAKDADELLNLKIKSFLWDSFYKNHTIIVSEFGGVWFKDFGSQPDVKYIEKVLLDVKERKLNFFMYKIDPYSDMSLVKNYDKFELTERGKVFFKHRKN